MMIKAGDQADTQAGQHRQHVLLQVTGLLVLAMGGPSALRRPDTRRDPSRTDGDWADVTAAQRSQRSCRPMMEAADHARHTVSCNAGTPLQEQQCSPSHVLADTGAVPMMTSLT